MSNSEAMLGQSRSKSDAKKLEARSQKSDLTGQVYEILEQVAEEPFNEAELGAVIAAYSHVNIEVEAHRFAAWVDGKGEKLAAPPAAFEGWLRRARSLRPHAPLPSDDGSSRDEKLHRSAENRKRLWRRCLEWDRKDFAIERGFGPETWTKEKGDWVLCPAYTEQEVDEMAADYVRERGAS
jgi:hypothetical protein